MVAALAALGVSGKVLVVVDRDDDAAILSFRNLGHVHLLASDQLNAYDILVNDWVVFTQATLPGAAAVDADSPADGDSAESEES